MTLVRDIKINLLCDILLPCKSVETVMESWSSSSKPYPSELAKLKCGAEGLVEREKKHVLPRGKPVGAASFKLKEATSISTSGASSPPRADNNLTRTRIHIKHTHVIETFSERIASDEKFMRRTYQNIPVKNTAVLSLFIIRFPFFPPSISTILATHHNSSGR